MAYLILLNWGREIWNRLPYPQKWLISLFILCIFADSIFSLCVISNRRYGTLNINAKCKSPLLRHLKPRPFLSFDASYLHTP